MNAIGNVKSIHGDKAEVVCRRTDACSSCHNCSNANHCSAQLIFGEQNSEITVRATNKIGAQAGDTVELSSPSDHVLTWSVLVFVLPVLLSVISYYVASASIHNSLNASIVLIVTFFVSFFATAKIINKFSAAKISIEITNILEERDV